MKKSILTICSLALSTAAVFAQQKLELTAKLPDLKENMIVRLWNPVDKVTDSTYVKNNSFSFSKPMNGGGSIFILQAGNEDPQVTGLGMVIYLEPGKLNISGTAKGFDTANLKGDAFVTDWVEMSKTMAPSMGLLNSIENLEAKLTKARELGDEETAKSVIAEKTLLEQQVAVSGKKYMDEHLSSGISAYILNAVLSNILSGEEKLAYLNKFSGNAKNNQISAKMLADLTGTKTQWVGLQAPDFKQPDANGKIVSLSDFKGKYVLVDFWASWCTPCLKELDELKSVYAKYKDRNFTIVGVSLDKDKQKWLASIAHEQLPWVQLSDLKAENNEAAQTYKVLGIPANFLIDPSGKIIGVGYREGDSPGSKILDKTLSKLLN